jgi:hypothetical protein
MLICVAADAVAVAVNVTGLPVRPVEAAVSVFVPATAPSCHTVSAAIPDPFVFTVSGPLTRPAPLLICPLPAVIVKTTATLLTGLPFASRTRTDGAVETEVLIAALWLLPAFRVICDAAPTEPVAVNVSGLLVSVPEVAVIVLLPAVVPSTHELNAAIPEALVTTVLPLGEEIVPPPVATAKTTLTPDFGFPLPSTMSTDGAIATALPATAVCASPALIVIVAAAEAVPVAVKTTGLPESPLTVACTVLVPAVPPSVHVVSAATPELFVVTVEPVTGDVVPLPAVVVKVTTTPWTGLLLASRTVTDGAVTVRPTVFVCEVAEPATMFCAVAAVLVPVNVTVVIAVAVAVTVFAAPAVRPNVHVESEATPELFDVTVATLAGLIDPAAAPEPPVAVNV